MRFYYISIFSVVFLGLIYLIGTGLLAWLGLWLRKRWRRAGMVMVPLFLLLYIAPIAEEFWIAWNFGRLCKKDAGLFVYKTVEVEGFYDDTHSWTERRMNEPAGQQFRFMEGRGQRNGTDVYWRHERIGGAIRSFEIDHPTARYHFSRDPGKNIAHKLAKQESRVFDSQTGEALGEYRVYIRKAPWFFIGLDRPNMGCDGPEGGPHSKHGNSFLIYRDILNPIASQNGEPK